MLTLYNYSVEPLPYKLQYPTELFNVKPGDGIIPPYSSNSVTIQLSTVDRISDAACYIIVSSINGDQQTRDWDLILKGPH